MPVVLIYKGKRGCQTPQYPYESSDSLFNPSWRPPLMGFLFFLYVWILSQMFNELSTNPTPLQTRSNISIFFTSFKIGTPLGFPLYTPLGGIDRGNPNGNFLGGGAALLDALSTISISQEYILSIFGIKNNYNQIS